MMKPGVTVLKKGRVFYKKVHKRALIGVGSVDYTGTHILELWVEAGSTVVKPIYPSDNKIRVEKAIVLSAYRIREIAVPRGWDTHIKVEYASGALFGKYPNDCLGILGTNLTYKVGEEIKANRLNTDPLLECAEGIHCFETIKQAERF